MRTSATVRSTRSLRLIRLRPSNAPVLPLMATVPSFRVLNASTRALQDIADFVRQLPGPRDLFGRCAIPR